MWSLTVIPALMVLHDYMKAPIDRLYFTNLWRPLLGIQNTFRDAIHCVSTHNVQKYPGLLLLKLHYQKIKDEFEASNAAAKYKILIETTSAIKRPILVKSSKVICFGYDTEKYSQLK